MDIFEQTQDAVDGGVGKHQDVVCVQVHLKDIQHSRHVALTSFVDRFVGSVLNAHTAQCAKQGTPP